MIETAVLAPAPTPATPPTSSDRHQQAYLQLPYQ